MEQMLKKKRNNSFLLQVLFFCFSGSIGFCQNQAKYNVLEIDSTTLAYYYIVKVNSSIGRLDENYNILSLKGDCKSIDTITSLKIKKGESYYFNLEPMYSIMDKRRGQDSIYLTPSFLGGKSVTINQEIFLSQDYSIHPYTTPNLQGLYYIKQD